jgi:UDP-N-acetylmuramate--alanine ligase
MQVLGDVKLQGGTVKVIDDYGHHPTEIDTTLRALKRHYQPRRLICVFQPHQHSRTRFLLNQFATSFSAADMVIVPEIYFVRDSEAERQSVSSRDLVERLQKKNIDASQLDPFEKITEHLAWIARDGDLIVTMGAGPVWKVSHALMKNKC